MKFKKENYYTDKKNDIPNTFYIRCQKFENRRLLQSEKIKYNEEKPIKTYYQRGNKKLFT